ncbi:DUF4190 domain-containing protein [Actinomadura sp. 6N118]|uniref:DUF4190 domain-containing protein n=1 Tax=Actinomadura sp. 6N118 TaxID=3375151 RepID=UPI003790AB18
MTTPPPGPTGVAPKTSRLAIASLVTGIVGCLSIVGVVLGVVALVRIRRTGERGQGLAIGGIVAGAVWSAIAVAVASGTLSVWTTPAERGADGVPRPVPTNEGVGGCFDFRGEAGDFRGGTVDLSCEMPHDAQAVRLYKAPAGPYPDRQAHKKIVETECVKAYRNFREPPSPDLILGARAINELDWAAGTRNVLCYVRAAQVGGAQDRPIVTSPSSTPPHPCHQPTPSERGPAPTPRLLTDTR